MDSSFHERGGFDPERIVTSTPRASQEREVQWLQAVSSNSQVTEEVEMSEDISTICEHDFSP
ncbi:unnamed protein product [Meloidogyne enterolobii]